LLRNIFRPDPAHPFQVAKFLSWGSLLLILTMGLFLSIFMANYARQSVMKKNHEFALLLAENLNHQIYQRFTLPTLIGFGRIQLKHEAQYDRLEKTIVSTIHSFHVLEVRIYDSEGAISFATNKELLGEENLGGKNVSLAASQGKVSFDLLNNAGTLKSFFASISNPRVSSCARSTPCARNAPWAPRKQGRSSACSSSPRTSPKTTRPWSTSNG
jgi:two-component system, NtrC family, sensor histidine kinase HydH